MTSRSFTLTSRQIRTLVFMSEIGTTTGYDLKIKGYGNLGTLNQLCHRKLVEPVGIDHTWFPQNGSWKITEAGVKIAQHLQNPE